MRKRERGKKKRTSAFSLSRASFGMVALFGMPGSVVFQSSCTGYFTLPYSFSNLGMLSGILLQIIYGLIGSWTAYLISVLYIEYRSRKEKVNVSYKNHVIQENIKFYDKANSITGTCSKPEVIESATG
ncbi:hypothetical protein RJ639_033189 [Escallonia herrerae]|uniref:Amino acid transporter transmembrane domain-containing protein n=1 Tax=Escallonia herrerae TaxID=1293975 RepID=A0AA89BGD6_9ASTE|nr:hypothetical protein RJ639_033189 [Escallonia herrerae]